MQHRLATDNDLDFIYDIYMDEHSNPYLTYDFMEKNDFEKIYAELLATKTLYVVEQDGRAIGTYRLIPKHYRQAHTVYLGSFGIPHSIKGKGYGFKILESLKENVKRNGQSRIELTVDIDNTAAIHLYKKAGFETEGTMRNNYKLNATGLFYDEYLMAVLL
jgi:putative acetyltransferase